MVDSQEDIDDPNESEESPAPVAAPAPAAAASDGDNTPDAPDWRSYLQSKMSAAQSQADDNSKLAGLARAGAFLSAGLAGSNQAVNQQPFDQLDREAQAPVQNLQAQAKAASDGMAMDSQQAEADRTSDANDPDSDASKRFRATLKSNFPQIAAQYGDSFDDLTAADQANVFKVVETKAKIDEQRTTADLKYKTLADSAANRNELASERASAKSSGSEDKALNQTQALLESARGNPAAAQAERDLYSAEKAQSLIRLYPDPNTMSQAQVNLLASEVGKIASGGVPSEHELQGITPDTLTGKMSSFVTKLTNNPTPANAAAFIQQYKDYTDALTKDAQNTIQDKYGRVIETRRGQLGEENYKNLQDQYVNRFTNSASKSASSSGVAPDLHGSVQAEIARRRASRAQSAPPIVPNTSIAPQASPSGVPSSLMPNQPQGFAYGGLVGGLPSSNFAAGQMNHVPKPPALHLHSPRGFAQGGIVPGKPQFNQNDPRNDVVPAQLSKGETVIPLSVMQSKDPAMGAYLFIKHLTKGN